MTSAVFRKLCFVAAALLLPAGAQALYDGDWMSIRGFGTLGAIWNSTDEASFRRSSGQPGGSRGDLEWRTDTNLGLQASTSTPTPWNATVQLRSSYNYDGSFDPELTWGFLSYEPIETVTFRAGRLGWDVYLLADSRHVGYSYMWARPPTEFFGNLQLYSFDGLDATFSHPVGGGTLHAKVFGGKGGHKVAINDQIQVDVDAPELVGFNIDYQSGNWQLRLGYTRLELELGLEGSITLPPPRQGAPSIDFSLDNLPESSVNVGFATAGVIGYQGPWEFQIMYSYADSFDDEVVQPFESAYASAGYRMGKWMPYATYATTSTQGENQPSPASSGLQQRLGNITGDTGAGQHTFSIGTRYDFRKNIALKLQVDRVHARKHGFWVDVEPGWDNKATLVSATLDFIF